MTGRNYGLEALIEEFCAEAPRMIEDWYQKSEGDSPIEKLFSTAIRCLNVAVVGHHRYAGIVNASFDPKDMPITEDKTEPWVIYCWRQYRVLDWKVDFLLGMQGIDGQPAFVVVECDGHDFHERTREQAERDRSRDRRLQDAGFRIYRFTGRELTREPMMCAGDALTGLLDHADLVKRNR